MAALKAFGMYDWICGGAGFKKSLLINTNKAMTHTEYSHLLNILGRSEEAMEQIEIGM